jgi:hypothetical protein
MQTIKKLEDDTITEVPEQIQDMEDSNVQYVQRNIKALS